VRRFGFRTLLCKFSRAQSLGLQKLMVGHRMIFLFRSGTVKEKLNLIFRATRTHAQNLAKYATVYKMTMLLLKHMGNEPGKEGPYDTFFSGLLGGYLVFGRRSKKGHVSSVSKQIVIFGKMQCSLLFSGANKPNSVCKSDTLLSQTLYPACGRHYQKSRIDQTNITRCMASVCSHELGKCHVAFQVVPRYDTTRIEEQYGLYLRPERSLGQSTKFHRIQ
jgi:hypothetical protein